MKDPTSNREDGQPAPEAQPDRGSRLRSWLARHGQAVAELALIGVWSLWIGRSYLSLDRTVWPIGREFGSQIISNQFWIQLAKCGTCALWNGAINGGAPALADVFGSMFHPLVALATLATGVVNGAKISVVGALWIAGAAQWWIARSLRLGFIARVWSAALVVTAGHLSARLDVGAVGLVISEAAASLALAAALALGVTGSRRSALVLAVCLAMAYVAGQGYLQVGLITVAPAFLFLVLDERLQAKPVWKEYALAIGVSLLVAAFLLVPALHFWPELAKYNDVEFKANQPLAYVPLNLVIDDFAYRQSSVLGKLPFPYLYDLFIGWFPVILALLSVRLARREHSSVLRCLGAVALLALFAASGLPFRWVAAIAPAMAAFRHPPLIASLAIPAILGLAAYSLDRLLHIEWPRLDLRWRDTSSAARPIRLSWLLILPALASLWPPMRHSAGFFKTTNVGSVYQAVRSFATPSLQWVSPPMGEHYWIEPALEQGLKVPNAVWAWGWRGRSLPPPRLMAGLGSPPVTALQVGSLGEIPLYEDPQAEYAAVIGGGTSTSCRASGSGGEIVVACTNDQAGRLLVQENAWGGWRVWIDGVPAQLDNGPWLAVEVPAGTHEYRFRYSPWDVPLGLVISLIGLGLLVYLWIRPPRSMGARPESTQD